MKNYFTFYFILGFISFTFAQGKVAGKVNYFMIIRQPDGTAYSNPYTLYFNDESSFFTRTGNAERLMSKEEKKMASINGQQVTNTITKSNLPQPFYYTNIKDQELIFRENVVKTMYLISDKIETIPWSLYNEHKKIGEYKCQKAKASFRGREYTIWFTTDIPVSHGPWKLRGLPGLILEVTEETGKYEFIANIVDLKLDNKILNEKLERPDTKGIKGMKIYIEALKNQQKDWDAIISASLPRGSRILKDCDICPDPNNRSLERFK
ncbi:GLPGLI family protein [Aquimarina algicola]|uniref:GLPGLI family protein n=1 Tax=Aquimarina algicola TaxID=2589995 RepID=A0A504JMC4_9FLAO|nr:GLPGLI family protein [Aquimarina algicola]TPN87909.1 GLPGLI family protein [Aquimarina algicola]